METFFLLCLIPVAIAVTAKAIFHYEITWAEMAAQIGAGALLLAILVGAGTAFATHDEEVLNGRVTGKVRDHGHYVESYSCRCRSVKSGNTTTTRCDTCYRDHYTVTWYLNSTVGKITIDHKDRTSRSVYRSPDPHAYQEVQIGQHCAAMNSYTNYVKGAPDSLFHKVGLAADKNLTVPKYPSVHDIYKFTRVIPVGLNRDSIMVDLDEQLDAALSTLGTKKQVNINVIIAKTNNKNYGDMVENEWIGGKKNDVNIVINAPQYPKIDQVKVFTFGRTADNNGVAIRIRNDLMGIGSLENPTKVSEVITTNVEKHFKRKSMKDYEYLKNEIEPPMWVIVLCIILSIGLGCGLTYYFHKNETF